ncbi:MAG: hypothetical protein DRN05_05760, partial [Thermoplasmata archaeon]
MNELMLSEELINNHTVLILVPNIDYNDIIIKTTRQLSDKKTCYVTLNKTYDALKEHLRLNNVDINNMFFIDGITKNVKNVENMNNCFFISSPIMLPELSKTISKILDDGFSYLVFDSITNLLSYQEESSVEYFLQNLVALLMEKKCRGVFYAVNRSMLDETTHQTQIRYPDPSLKKQSQLVDRSKMFIDKIIDVERKKQQSTYV